MEDGRDKQRASEAARPRRRIMLPVLAPLRAIRAILRPLAGMLALRRFLPQIGIGGRLFLAFGVVAGLTVLASALAFISYTHLSSTLTVVAGDDLPAVDASLRIAKTSAEIAATAPALVLAINKTQTVSPTMILRTKQDELAKAIEALAATPGRDEAPGLSDNAATMKQQLERIAGAVERRLAAADARGKAIAAINAAHRAIAETLKPLLDEARGALESPAMAEGGDEDLDALKTKMAQSAKAEARTAALFELRGESDLLHGLLMQAAMAPRKDLLSPLKSGFGEAVKATEMALAAAATGDVKDLAQKFAALTAIGTGEAGVFASAEHELEAAIEAQKVLIDNRLLAGRFGLVVQKLVSDAEEAAHAAEAASQDEVESGKRQLVGIAIASLLVAIGIAWLYVGRAIMRRLAKLRQSMLAVAGGDLDAAIPAGGRDEITEMASALTVFRDTGKAAKLAEQQRREERARAAEARRQELLALAESFEGSVKSVVETVSRAAADMRTSAETMVSVASATSEQSASVAAASSEASTNVSTVAAAAEELTATTHEIGNHVTQSAAIAGRAVHEAEATNTTVNGLLEASQKIGDVVKLISDIARQTNLLALNATIEAARAGEAGKGFAVVASEVKSLANQTAKATEEIASQIGNMQTATREAATAIQSIGKTIARIDETATAIAAAVEEQSATTQTIAGNINRAAVGTDAVSSTIAEVARAADQSGSAARQVLDGAAALASQSDTLRNEVEGFLERVRAA